MTRGGARNRAGRNPQPGSETTFALTALPAEGWTGEIPEFPLPDPSPRELVVWERAWRTPQACAWQMPSERWRVPTVAMWVRQSVACEAADAPPTRLAQLHRFADQIGMTTAGLREMGWKVAADEVGAKRVDKPAEDAPKSERRLRSVNAQR